MGIVCEIVASHRAGHQRVRETVEQYLQRIEKGNAPLNAVYDVEHEDALKRADVIDQAIQRGDETGPLAGVPFVVKDNICARGRRVTCGSRMLQAFRSQYDAHAYGRLLHAGAIPVARGNLDEFAMGSSSENSAHGPVRNPWDTGRVAGGSSGGSAAAVAAGMVPMALGSDTGGSIRQPASFCGVTGIKPTYGRVSRSGLVAFGSSLDQIGPLTHDVLDSARLLSVLAGHDPHDSTSLNIDVPDYEAACEEAARGLRIGVLSDASSAGLDPEIRQLVDAGVEVLKSQGATVREVTVPHIGHSTACYYIIATAEASSNLARFDAVRYGMRAESSDIGTLYTQSRAHGLGAEVKRRIMLGTYVLSSGYYEAYYDKALRVRTLLREGFARAFEEVDVIASPVCPITAFPLGEKVDDPLAMYLTDVYTVSANLAGICAMSVPCGLSANGMPVGMQFMGPILGETKIIRAGAAFQRETGFHQLRPPAIDSRSSGTQARHSES